MKTTHPITRVYVDYGYDVHSIEMASSTWALIQVGQPIELAGQGFHVEGEVERDIWTFAGGSVSVSTETGLGVFSGRMNDPEVWVEVNE